MLVEGDQVRVRQDVIAIYVRGQDKGSVKKHSSMVHKDTL